MFDAQRAKRPEHDQSQAAPAQKTTETKRSTQHPGNLTRIPLYTQLAWGNQPPPWLRLSVQRRELPEEHPLQGRDEALTQRKENTTGLPDTLKRGIENLSGLSMDDVQVHYQSPQPAEIQAVAYTQGTDIHVGPGQEKHLVHEAWHVVQQKRGRVKPTLQAKGVAINDDEELEKEADVMGEKARNFKEQHPFTNVGEQGRLPTTPVQRRVFIHSEPPPPAVGSNGTYIATNINTTTERSNLYSDLPLYAAVSARQPTTSNPFAKNPPALRHIIPYSSFLTDAQNLAGQTLLNVATHVHNNWPATSLQADPGIPAMLNNNAVQAYVESWIEARHHDPANLFFGYGPENSGIGGAYDNPTQAGGQSKTPGTAFNQAERQALILTQLNTVTGGNPWGVAGETIDIAGVHGAAANGPITTWLINFCNYNNWPQAYKTEYQQINTQIKLFAFLTKVDIFKRLTLPAVFRHPANLFGTVP